MYKKLSVVIFILLCLSATSVFAAVRSDDNVWQKINDSNLSKRSLNRGTIPERYSTFRLNKTSLQNVLTLAPMEAYTIGEKSEIILTFPMPDGTFERFAIKESQLMEPELAAKFPEIKTYLGQGLDNPTATVSFDYTPQGFHGMILSDQGTTYVNPYAKGDTDNYISFRKSDVRNPNKHICYVGSEEDRINFSGLIDKKYNDTSNVVFNDNTLRTYRLAVAAQGEYTTFHGGAAGALTAIMTTMTRVNGIYQRELSLRMVLVANNNLIIYTNPATDPYSANTSSSTVLNENQANLDAVIGSANYDIGHVFNTGGGGLAQLRAPCGTGKARGATGLGNPQGDVFDVDFVSHEIGHQWGGNHTFNGSSGNCSGGNRNGTTAYEPGSGSTIQAYAGICSPQNIQSNSHDYFHILSLEEMVAFSSNAGTGGSCSANTGTSNSAPTVSVVGGTSFNIPRNTPFTLTATGTDPNGHTVTYNWEEYSLGAQAAPSSTADAPMFRSYPATTNPSRTFPSLTYILNNDNVAPATYTGTSATGAICTFGNCITAEFLSSISRTMPFQVTARDNQASGGAIRSTMATVIVDANSGPFKVTAQDSLVAPNWSGNSTQTVTWNVANTTNAPVSAANVSISLSTDGGQTFPFVLAANTPNDGSEQIIVPNQPTTQARIKVQAVNNIFFDISNVNFTIVSPTAAPASVSGRVVTSTGRGIPRTFVTLVNAVSGESVKATTNQFGYFRFVDLDVSNLYTLTVNSKQYTFPNPTQTFTLNEDLTGISFVGFAR